MIEPTHVRTGHTIRDMKTGERVKYDSINSAKRASRSLQKGGAVLRVEQVPARQYASKSEERRHKAQRMGKIFGAH